MLLRGRRVKVSSRTAVLVAVGAPLVATYVDVLKAGHPCISVNPTGSSNTMIRMFNLKHPSGIRGAVYSGVGDTIEVVERSKLFTFEFDTGAPRDFVRLAVEKAYSVVKKYTRCYLLFAYTPVGSRIPVDEECKSAYTFTEYIPIPPQQDLDACAPRRVGDCVEHMNQNLGYIGVGVSPMYIYVVAGYGLALVPRIQPQLGAQS